MSRQALWGLNPIGKRFLGCMDGSLREIQKALIVSPQDRVQKPVERVQMPLRTGPVRLESRR